MRLVVLGDPVTHSLSPAIHRAALLAAGISGTYEARNVDDEGMRQAVSEIRNGDLDGANVTMPHKQLALQLADVVSETASSVGAANTLCRVDGRVEAHNTDVTGIQRVWRSNDLPADRPVLVLGAGGAAAAALEALTGMELIIAARSNVAAKTAVDGIRGAASTVGWGIAVSDAVVVNATPLGMHLESLPPGLVEAASGLFDMAYGAGKTPAVRSAMAEGIPWVQGEDMLLAQAEVSFRLWTGIESDQSAMRAGLIDENNRRGHV